MKILFVIDSLGTGGAEHSTFYLWNYLKSQGVEFRIIALRHRKEGVEADVMKRGWSVHFVNARGFFFQSKEISDEIRKFKPDWVHSILFKSNLRTRLARIFTKFRHIESLVNCMYDPVRLNDPGISTWGLRFYKMLDRQSKCLVSHFLAISKEVKRHYESAIGISGSRISVIYRGRPENPGINERASLKQKYLAELSLGEDTMLITHVGRQEFQKGHLVLLQALKKIQANLPGNVVFLLLGREGNQSVAIQNFVSDDFKADIRFLGHRSDVQQILAASDLFVFPSRYEGLGGALIEAQAAGLPIICSDLTVAREVVIENQNALLFKNGDASELAKVLLRLINNKALREEMGESSLRNFRDNFLIDLVNKQTLTFYESELAL